MKAVIALVIAFHALYLASPELRHTLRKLPDLCPLGIALAALPHPIDRGDRNGLNPR